ncbi:MAG TPA: hypothetical protein VFK38_03635 [Candidatus Limnocylindrales bacterium]|nr:hypothetical protein [Candidatus Limnocylindrales bacterium]
MPDPTSPPDERRARGPLHRARPLARHVLRRLRLLSEQLAARLRPGAATLHRRWRGRAAARQGRLRRRARQPLASLHELHPEVSRASRRELGLRTVPVSAIRGTAVEGPAQRGGDFRPLPRFRGANWLGRWQRILRAADRLEVLPPVDLVKFGDDYWVEDGHNRVAAALYVGQVAIDAMVTELRLPGMPHEPAPTGIAPLLTEGRSLRAAGQGRLSSTAEMPDAEIDLPSIHEGESPHHHAPRDETR